MAIHLWNIRPGKVLKVGSISLMEAASRKSSRSLKLINIPLFILRCLLLIILALLLAIPLWQKRLQAGKVKGWILVPKENLQESYPKFKPQIDSLTNAGYEFHYFNNGFQKSDLRQILAHLKDSAANESAQFPNYWHLVNELDTLVAPTLPLYIFTPNQAIYFTGEKPRATLNLHWQTYIPADSTSKWIESAWINNNNTIRVEQGESKPSGTSYTYTDIKSDDQPNSSFNVNVSNGQATIGLKSVSRQLVIVDTTTLHIAVYADNNTIDAGYLKAALQAVNQFTQRKTIIKQYNDPGTIPTGQNWLFWLSEKPVSGRLLQQTRNIFRYEKGKIVNSGSWLSDNSVFSVSLQQGQKIGLYKLIETSQLNNNTIWRNGFGHPVLSVQRQAQTNIYNFYSRFDPAWNDLVWSNEFPGWMMKLMVPGKTSATNKYDKRILDQQQITPGNVNQTHAVAIKTTGFANLSNYFWLLLALLFLAERWLANKTQTITTNG